MSLTKLQELQEKRGKLHAQIKTKGDEYRAAGNKWADGEEANWTQLNKDYDAVMVEIENENRSKSIADRLAQIEDQSRQSTNTRGIGRDDAGRDPGQRRQGQEGAVTVTEQTRITAFNAAVRSMAGIKPSREGREAMKLCRYGGMKDFEMPWDETRQYRNLVEVARSGRADGMASRLNREVRAMESIALAKGGVLVPQTLMRMIEVNMLYYGPMLVTSDTIITGNGGNFTWPTFDDTANTATQVGENTSVGTAADASLGGLVLGSFKQTSGVLLVSEEAMRDSVIDLVPIIAEALGQRLGRKENTLLTTGSGANTVQGIVGSAGLGATTSGQAITFDKLIELYHSVDVAYRNAPGVGWMMHDSVAMAVRLLRDSDNSLLWKGGANHDQMDRIEGKPVYINNDMDSAITTGKKSALFGDLSKNKIRRAGGLRFYRMDERYRDLDQTGFVAFSDLDAGLLDAGTKPVKYLLIG